MIKLTNMVMIVDKPTGRVLAQERRGEWAGLSFPGGKVEPGEAFYDSAVRETLEETGLAVGTLTPCGVIHWIRRDADGRYLAFLYKTDSYSGELIEEMAEGRNLWLSVEELYAAPSENCLHEILTMFLRDDYCEAVGSWDAGGSWTIDRFIGGGEKT